MKNRIESAFSKLHASEELEDRVKALESKPRYKSSKVRFTAILVAAALLIVSVGAIGLSRLYYLPGAGLVDDSGTLVIKESDIGELAGVTAYKTPSALEFGDYHITSVTYVDYDGDAGYAVWTNLGDELVERNTDPERGELAVPISSFVLDDLTLTLSDGTELAPESTRYSHGGMIVYNFAGEVFDDSLTLSSESVGESLDVRLAKVENVGYSYMQYPTDRGITLMISPQDEDFDSFDVKHINGALGELEDYVRTTVPFFPTFGDETFAFIGSDGNRYYPSKHGWHKRSSETRYVDEQYVSIDKPKDVDIVGIDCSRLYLEYILVDSENQSVELEMPDDGERIDRRVTLFDGAGIKVEITAWEREGEIIRIYADGASVDTDEWMLGGYVPNFGFPVENEHEADQVYALLRVASLNTGKKTDGLGYSGGFEISDDGEYMRSYDFSASDNPSLDETVSFTLELEKLTCEYNGNWNIEY